VAVGLHAAYPRDGPQVIHEGKLGKAYLFAALEKRIEATRVG
jgi:hypothetical protein